MGKKSGIVSRTSALWLGRKEDLVSLEEPIVSVLHIHDKGQGWNTISQVAPPKVKATLLSNKILQEELQLLYTLDSRQLIRSRGPRGSETLGLGLAVLLVIIIALGAANAAGSFMNNNNNTTTTTTTTSTSFPFSSSSSSLPSTTQSTTTVGRPTSYLSSSQYPTSSSYYYSSATSRLATDSTTSTTESWTSVSLTQTLPTEISGCQLPGRIPTEGYNIAPKITDLNSSKKYVVLRFDDTLQSQWLNALPVLAKYHFKALFLAITSAINPTNQTGYPLSYPWSTMSWPEMEWLYQNGFEVADHTATHPDLNFQSCAGLVFQIYESRQTLFSHNMTFIPIFVDPSAEGSSNLTVADYIYASGFNEIYPVTPYSLIKQPDWYDMDAFGNPKQSLGYFESIVNQTNSTNVIGVFYHNVNDHVPCCTPFYTNTTLFDQEMSYLYQNNFTVVLPDELPWY